MKVLLSAAEVSSDAHGAELLKALKALSPSESIEVFGIGGQKLQGEGLETIVDARTLLSMGFVEVLGKLPRILKAISRIEEEAARRRPDIAVLMDYPDFHFRLAKRLRRLKIPMVYYIPPKVWVWRKERVHFLKEHFSRILCIFPFEEAFYRKAGVKSIFVGNPLLDELPLDLSRNEARKRLDLEEDSASSGKTVVLMPGSRPAELKRHLQPMLRAVIGAQKALKIPIHVLMPLPFSADAGELRRRAELILDPMNSNASISLRVLSGMTAECLRAADAGLIKSGTSTLEAALLECPHAVVYKPNWISSKIYRHLVRYKGPVGLVNLVAGVREEEPRIAREILCEEVSDSNLTEALLELLQENSPAVSRMKGSFQKIRIALGERGASENAAKEILEVLRCSEA